ncbi:unnamed protein product [Rodentolepis nana]|uniref:Protein Wnt n=1 Tax=Rodentolepis nana TaxID=102285 RepID=A0A0R3TIX2_RODNA|nr:unnamed protein product [Rodentolepis nana]
MFSLLTCLQQRLLLLHCSLCGRVVRRSASVTVSAGPALYEHVAFDSATRQLIRQADPLFFGGMPLPPGHLTKRSANWFIAGGGEKVTPWQRIKRETEFGENWIRRQKDKLVFMDYSPDYCKVDPKIG